MRTAEQAVVTINGFLLLAQQSIHHRLVALAMLVAWIATQGLLQQWHHLLRILRRGLFLQFVECLREQLTHI